MDVGKKTALYDSHKKHGGKIVNFAGWALPVEFEGLIAEHEAVRTAAGIFDVSHMGEVEIKGNQAQEFLQSLVTNDISVLKDNQILYTFMCYPHGGIVDDFLIYKFADKHFFLVLNAGNLDKDLKWLEEHRADFDVDIIDLSQDISEIALQGPKSEKILQKLTDTDLSSLGAFYCKRNVIIDGLDTIISRTGYTGEDGFEIYLSNDNIVQLWESLLDVGREEGIKPAGLGARDTLRFEAGLPLYGNELSEDITPLEAGLGFFVKLDKEEDFIGKDALAKQKEEGLKRKIVAFEMLERGIPRQGYQVLGDGKKIGSVTTGYYSPTLKKSIGKAMIDIEYSKLETPIEIKIRKRILKARTVKGRFYSRNSKK